MDRIKLIAVLCAGVVASQALAQQHSKPMRNPQSAAERQAMQTEQEKIRRFKTDEGEMGQTRWTEYTVNPAAKGEGTLVLVLGGRDSLGSSSPPDECRRSSPTRRRRSRGRWSSSYPSREAAVWVDA